jgi:hypothetical protein
VFYSDAWEVCDGGIVVSTITGTGSIADSTTAMMSSYGVIAVLVLLALLAVKELAIASENPRLQLLGLNPHVAVVPLLFVFCLIIVADLL